MTTVPLAGGPPSPLWYTLLPGRNLGGFADASRLGPAGGPGGLPEDGADGRSASVESLLAPSGAPCRAPDADDPARMTKRVAARLQQAVRSALKLIHRIQCRADYPGRCRRAHKASDLENKTGTAWRV